MINIEHECCKKLVNYFCYKPIWPKELKIAKKLLRLSPDVDAWLSLVLPYRINSLSFFLSPNGEIFVPTSQRNPYLLDLDKLHHGN